MRADRCASKKLSQSFWLNPDPLLNCHLNIGAEFYRQTTISTPYWFISNPRETSNLNHWGRLSPADNSHRIKLVDSWSPSKLCFESFATIVAGKAQSPHQAGLLHPQGNSALNDSGWFTREDNSLHRNGIYISKFALDKQVNFACNYWGGMSP